MSRRDLEQRLANTTWSRPPPDVPMGTCWCGAAYIDTDIGADAHEVVMGHRPEPKGARDPTTEQDSNDTSDEPRE